MSLNYSKGLYFALAAAVISGVSIFLNKFAVEAVNNPLIFTTTKNSLVGILILILIIFSGKLKQIKSFNKSEIIKLVLIGIVGGSIPFYLFFQGLSEIPAVNAAIIQKTLVLWVVVLAIPFLREKLSKLQLLAIIFLFAGNIFVGGFEGFQFSRGEFLILTAAIFWAVESILAKKVLNTIDSNLLILARMGFGSLILMIATFLTTPLAFITITDFNQNQWFWIIITAALLLAYVATWFKAIKFAPVITVTSVLVISTLITNILSAIFVTHSITNTTLIQALFIITGLFVFTLNVVKLKKYCKQKLALLKTF